MPEVRILPNGLKPVTAEAAVFADGRNPAFVRPKIIGMKIGEIIKGSVLEKINENLLKISFPFGVVNAAIEAKLIPGDSLFFVIEKNEPNLVVKIHSVSVKLFGEELSEEEIARVLNVKEFEFTYLAISRLKTKFSTILRSDLIKIIGLRNSLSENEIKFYTERNIAEILSELLYLNADLNRNNFLKFARILLKPNDLQKAIQYVFNFVNTNAESNQNSIIQKIKIIESKEFEIIDGLQLFLNRELNKAKLCFLAKDIVEFIHQPNIANFDKTFINALKIIYSGIDSQSAYNFRAYLRKSFLTFYFVYKINSNYKLSQIFVPYSSIAEKSIKLNIESLDTEFLSDKFALKRPFIVLIDKNDNAFIANILNDLSNELESQINYLFPKIDSSEIRSDKNSGFSIVM